ESFSLNDWKNGQNIAAGTIKYYRLTIPESRQYYIQAYNYGNAYFYLYVNGNYYDSSSNLGRDFWLSTDDEVIVVVKGQAENASFSYQFTVYPW
ncbi:MAG: hypothetical protein LBP81_00660, partial [Treponema sp.]|nr:hypothetical protein [Treponema sp.]